MGFAFAFALVSLGSSCPAAREARPPNILVIVADDLGYSDIGAYGSEIRTPTLDALAGRSHRLTSYHTGATCSPSRSMLMTGVDNHLNGMAVQGEFVPDELRGLPGYEGHMNDRVATLGTVLKDRGYQTYMTGKWHLGHGEKQDPHRRGFDRTFALIDGAGDNWSDAGPGPISDRMTFTAQGERVERPEGHSSVLYVDRMLEFIEEGKSKDRPFFGYLSFQAVHWPYHGPRDLIDEYEAIYAAGWDAVRSARFERLRALGLIAEHVEYEARDPRIRDWESVPPAKRREEARRMAAYAAMLEHMDTQIGRLFDRLNEWGMAEETAILFVSDNGADQSQPMVTWSAYARETWYAKHYPDQSVEGLGSPGSFTSYGPQWAHVGNSPLAFYKGTSWEGGLRVPLLVHLPGQREASDQPSFAFVTDVFATIVDLARGDETFEEAMSARPGPDGEPLHAPRGRSMLPTLRGEQATFHPEDEAVGYELQGRGALFLGEWKLLQEPGDRWALYDIRSDPGERFDRAQSESERFERMRALYAEYRAENGVQPMPADFDQRVRRILTQDPDATDHGGWTNPGSPAD